MRVTDELRPASGLGRCPAVSQSTSCQQHPGRASHEGDGSNETQAVLRSGVFTASAIRNPQIAKEKKSLMDGKKAMLHH